MREQLGQFLVEVDVHADDGRDRRAMVLSTLPASSAGFSFSFAAFDLTNTIRIGHMLADVGPHLRQVVDLPRASASSTGLSSQTLCVRAWRKMRSRASSLRTLPVVAPRGKNKVGSRLAAAVTKTVAYASGSAK